MLREERECVEIARTLCIKIFRFKRIKLDGRVLYQVSWDSEKRTENETPQRSFLLVSRSDEEEMLF